MKRVLIGSLALSLLIWVAAPAQESSGREQRLRDLFLHRYDSDGDGRLSSDERERARQDLGARRTRSASPGPSSLTGLYGQESTRVALESYDLELYDADRDKSLPFRATFPKGERRWPVIVWSHGLYGSQDNYQPLVEHWASHGYMVLQPSHSDSLRRGRGDFSRGMSGNTGDWDERPKDISFLLDSLASQPKLAPHADLARVGVGGHSFGAHTTMLVSGARPVLGGDLSDPRPRAFLAVSPQGESRLLNSSSWQGLNRPTLFISGDNDDSPSGEKASWRRQPFERCPAGQKSLMWVEDAYHNFGGISGVIRSNSGPAVPDQVELVKSATLAFWDSYLKESPQAQNVIVTGDVGADRGRGSYSWERR